MMTDDDNNDDDNDCFTPFFTPNLSQYIVYNATGEESRQRAPQLGPGRSLLHHSPVLYRQGWGGGGVKFEIYETESPI